MDAEQAAVQAEDALRLVQIDLRESTRLATATLDAATAGGFVSAASIAERALGLAAVHRQELDSAMHHLRAAIRLGNRSGVAELAGEARMTYAFALNRAGKGSQAVAEIDIALAQLGPLRYAEGLVQRAAILQQLGRLDDALRDYRAGLSTLRRADDSVWIQRALLNRGLLYAFRHDYGSALRDLQEAERVCTRLGLALPSAFVHENLLLVYRRLGDVPTALDHLAEAERIYKVAGASIGSLLVERSQLLISVGLFAEAREAAEEAVAEFSRAGRSISIPEARLLLARTAALTGDGDRAELEARRALREFSHQDRPEWLALARCALLLTKLDSDAGLKIPTRTVAAAAADAEARGWPATAMDLRLMAGERWLHQARRRNAAHAHLRQVGQARSKKGSASRRAKGWYATALLRRSNGDPKGSSLAAARGLKILDDYRDTMTATDLRARVSHLGTGLARVGLRNALDGGDAATVMQWAELGRARHLIRQPVLPPADAELTGLTAQLRAVVSKQVEAQIAGQVIDHLSSRQHVLERAIRDASRRGAGQFPPLPSPPQPSDLQARLGDAALVEFIQCDDYFYAVTVATTGMRLHRLAEVGKVAERVRWLPFAVGRLARGRTSRVSAEAALAVVERTAGQLDELLLTRMGGELDGRKLVLVRTGVLQSLPWSMLPSLRGRPVCVAPSAGMWLRAADAVPRPGRILVVAGPTLPGARQEATQIAHAYGVEPLHR